MKNITTFVFDVDGVLTDGHVIALASGEQARTFLVKDGYAIEQAIKAGYRVVIISGGFQEGVRKRLEFLGISDIFLNVKLKLPILEKYLSENKITPEEVLYMGDDIPDIDPMNFAGIGACPADAAEDVLAISKYISAKAGGKGAVREVIEKVMKVQNTWLVKNRPSNA